MFQTLNIPAGRKVLFPNLYKQIDEALTNRSSFAYLFKGDVGTGKSELMNIIASCFSNDRMLFSSTTEIYEDYLSISQSDFSDKGEALKRREYAFKRPYIFIDDLGIETTRYAKANAYIEAGIYKMYDAWKRHGRFCYIITTNMGLPGRPSIQEVYGARVEDRIIEMFTIVEFKHKSFRQNNRKIHKEVR